MVFVLLSCLLSHGVFLLSFTYVKSSVFNVYVNLWFIMFLIDIFVRFVLMWVVVTYCCYSRHRSIDLYFVVLGWWEFDEMLYHCCRFISYWIVRRPGDLELCSVGEGKRGRERGGLSCWIIVSKSLVVVTAFLSLIWFPFKVSLYKFLVHAAFSMVLRSLPLLPIYYIHNFIDVPNGVFVV
jgi:hypothetical protein